MRNNTLNFRYQLLSTEQLETLLPQANDAVEKECIVTELIRRYHQSDFYNQVNLSRPPGAISMIIGVICLLIVISFVLSILNNGTSFF
jgi:hypothetical protein